MHLRLSSVIGMWWMYDDDDDDADHDDDPQPRIKTNIEQTLRLYMWAIEAITSIRNQIF